MDNKKIRTLICIVTVFWIAAFTQILVNYKFMDEKKITTAFAATNAKMIESRLEVTARCNQKEYTERKQIIEKINEKVGHNGKLSVTFAGNKDNTYLSVKLSMSDKMNRILEYRTMIENILNDWKITDYQTMLKFTGEYSGQLSDRQKQEETDNLMNKLGAEIVSKSIDQGLYSIYGYTGLVKDYMNVAGYRVNINIVFSYDEKKNVTNIYLATPILNGDY